MLNLKQRLSTPVNVAQAHNILEKSPNISPFKGFFLGDHGLFKCYILYMKTKW
ncbi:hypothetical protein T190611E02C_20373 [Tenacibaculum sp. 190524A05c]